MVFGGKNSPITRKNEDGREQSVEPHPGLFLDHQIIDDNLIVAVQKTKWTSYALLMTIGAVGPANLANLALGLGAGTRIVSGNRGRPNFLVIVRQRICT